MRITLLLILILTVATLAQAAHDVVTVRPLTPAEVEDRWFCIYGNRSSASGYEGWWGGSESYARLIDPRVEECECDIGFSIRSVKIMLGLDSTANLAVMARLLEVDDPYGCPRPGVTLAWSPIHNIQDIEVFGYYEITIPCDFPCAAMDEPFLITVDFLYGDADRVIIVGGGDAETCVNYNDWGQGWVDLVADIGFLDGLTIWAESECCYTPIGTETSSWGSVKSLYR